MTVGAIYEHTAGLASGGFQERQVDCSGNFSIIKYISVKILRIFQNTIVNPVSSTDNH